jgi:hypothetical protein
MQSALSFTRVGREGMQSTSSMSEGLDSLMTARRLARSCPTSLSLEDITSEVPPVFHFPPQSESMVTEASPEFRVPLPPPTHRFGFLLADIKPIETGKHSRAMRFELPNVKRMRTSIKSGNPVMVVSVSEDHE